MPTNKTHILCLIFLLKLTFVKCFMNGSDIFFWTLFCLHFYIYKGNGKIANMIAVATLLILCLDLISGQGTPKRLQIASMTAKIGKDGTGKMLLQMVCIKRIKSLHPSFVLKVFSIFSIIFHHRRCRFRQDLLWCQHSWLLLCNTWQRGPKGWICQI